tara:strand:- start:6834 stop:7373 length:540 start_codon:yes stop_codon:yes gene_type:complete
MKFWNNSDLDPKRRYRFILNIGNIPVWVIKTTNKPKVNINTVEHTFLNHTFKYPGRASWDPISVTLVDPLDPDMAKTMLDRIVASGYQYPTDENKRGTISKKASVQQGLIGVSISQINGEGGIVETWTLTNPWVSSIDFGGALDYSSDDMNEITMEIVYDYAVLSKAGNGVRYSQGSVG